MKNIIVIFGFEISDNDIIINDFDDEDAYTVNNEYLDIRYYCKKRYLGIILNDKRIIRINPYDIEALRLKLYTKLQKFNIKIPFSYKPQIYIF